MFQDLERYQATNFCEIYIESVLTEDEPLKQQYYQQLSNEIYTDLEICNQRMVKMGKIQQEVLLKNKQLINENNIY